MLPLRLSLVLFALASLSFAQSRVWVVDDDGGAGTDFTDIQPAVDAAADGDVVLVKAGTYGIVRINGKSIVLQGDVGGGTPFIDAPVNEDGLAILGLAAGQEVVVRHLRIDGVGGGIVVQQCVGSVRLEECLANLGTEIYPREPGLKADRAHNLVLLRCTLRGESGKDNFPWMGDLDAYPGLTMSLSTIHAYDCTIRGGNGGRNSGTPSWGGDGGDGVSMNGGFLFLSGCQVQGGIGTHEMQFSGVGGHGIDLDGNADVVVLDSSVVGGDTEDPSQPDGEDFSVGSGSTVGHLPGTSLSCVASSPVRESESLALDLSGPPHVPVWFAVSTVPFARYYEFVQGSLLIAPPMVTLDLGFLDGNGALQANLPIFAVPGDFLHFYGQSYYLDPVHGLTLGAGTTTLLLDGIF